jgi:hypothetical protein
MLVVFSLLITIICFVMLWVENIWDGFFHLGPPFQVGSIVIDSWLKWWVLLGLLILYQCTNVYMEETLGREIERQHIEKKKWTPSEVFYLSCYNLYKWLGTILHILVAVTRLDIWFAIALVDTLARAFMWKPSTGRTPRF